MALKARNSMPKDYSSFCLVAAHLVKNAHRYWKSDISDQEVVECMDEDNETKLVHKSLMQICTLKRQNRISEQQAYVTKLKDNFGSYRNIAQLSSIPLKTVHEWCMLPKDKKHKGTSRAALRRNDFVNFLMQNTVTYSSPCKKFAGKRFLL